MRTIILATALSLLCFFSHAQNVGIGTTTPIARLQVADSNVVFTGPATIPETTNYNPPIQGAGTRMMWYPQKGAFRVGSVDGTQWDKNNIGRYSFGAGSGNIASGTAATALGNATLALGISSTATGNASQALGTYSTAMGGYTVASGFNSMATGIRTTAKSYGETVIGSYNTDYTPLSAIEWMDADRLFVVGNGNYFDATSPPADAMVILKNGNTGIGTSSPNYKLHIGQSASGLRIEGPAVTNGVALSIGGFGELQIDKPGTIGGRLIVKDNGNIGIGNNSPNAPLAFPALLGKKITLYPGGTGDAGFGISGNRLKIYSDNPNADVAIGYDVAGTFNERFAFKPNGALAINGVQGIAGQVITSHGSGNSATWEHPASQLFNNTNSFNQTQNFSFPVDNIDHDLPGLDQIISLSQTSKVLISMHVSGNVDNCALCLPPIVRFKIIIDNNTTAFNTFQLKVANGDFYDEDTGFKMITLNAGSHNIKMTVSDWFGGNLHVSADGSAFGGTRMLVIAIPQ